jgi:hypothetical protein
MKKDNEIRGIIEFHSFKEKASEKSVKNGKKGIRDATTDEHEWRRMRENE